MYGLQFRVHKPIQTSAPNRVDIACFVGLIGYRSPSSTEKIRQSGVGEWLYTQGWQNKSEQQTALYHRESASTLMDVPVPIENWEIFDELYAWDKRIIDPQGTTSVTYLGAAVRSFFRQGGRKCYVIRVDDPPYLNAAAADREALLTKIIPGFSFNTDYSCPPENANEHTRFEIIVDVDRTDRFSWRGIGHLFGLPDVSFLSLPDLPDLLKSDTPQYPAEPPETLSPPEQFVECSEPETSTSEDFPVERIPAPRFDETGFDKWQLAIRTVAQFLAAYRREVQLVAGIPLPDAVIPAQTDLLGFMHGKKWLSKNIDEQCSLSSAFVQLCYPWVRTVGSRDLPEGLESPEGVMVGLLARNALTRGTFRSATALRPQDIVDLTPKLSEDRIYALNPKAPEDASENAALIHRVSLLAPSPEGIQLLSDVTTSNSILHRQASINRIIALIVRAARRAGEEFVFETSGEQLWSQLRDRLTDLLQTLFNVGALRGESAAEAYQVRCDRSVMSQQDIDAGRVIAHILFQPAASIESIDVLLSMGNSGQISLASTGVQETAS